MNRSIVPKVILGNVHISEGVLDNVPLDKIKDWIDNHECGDWGQINESDKLINDCNLINQSVILSVWQLNSCRVFIITEGTHTDTFVVLPSDLRKKDHELKKFKSRYARKIA